MAADEESELREGACRGSLWIKSEAGSGLGSDVLTDLGVGREIGAAQSWDGFGGAGEGGGEMMVSKPSAESPLVGGVEGLSG